MKSDSRLAFFTSCFLTVGIWAFAQSPSKPSTGPFVETNSIGVPLEKLRAMAEWREFLDLYTATSPIEAINKTAAPAFQLSEEHIKEVLQGKTKVRFSPPRPHKGELITDFDFFESPSARRFEVSDSSESTEPAEDNRFKKIVESSHQLISKRGPQDLVILLLGQTHAEDIYFSFFLRDRDRLKRDPILPRRDEILYVSDHYTDSSEIYLPSYYDFLAAVDGVRTPVEVLRDWALPLVGETLGRIYYYNELLQRGLKIQDLKPRPLSHLGVLIFMDIRNINETKAFESLPPADALKRAGIKSIRFGLEGWKFGREYKVSDMKYLYRSPFNPKLRDYQEDFLKKKNPKMFQKYERGEIIKSPRNGILHQKAQAYESAGLQITVTGLEDFETFPVPSN